MTEEKNEVVVAETPGGKLHESEMATKCSEWLGAPAKSIINLLREQIIAVPQGKPPATGAETALVLSVMNQYQLDPFARMVSAWRDWTGKLCIQVEQNGWTKMAKAQPGYLRASWAYGPIVASPGGKGKQCYEWVECTIHDSALGDITAPKVWLEEEFVPSRPNKKESNWEIMPKRRLPQRAYNNALRFAYGFSVYDAFDQELMADKPTQEAATEATQETMDNLTAAVAGTATEAEDADYETVEEPSAVDEEDIIPPDITCDELYAGTKEAFDQQEESPGEPLEAVVEDLGAPPAQDTGTHKESPQGPPAVPGAMVCVVAGCAKAGTMRCGVCGERYCSVHMGAGDGVCQICGAQ